VSIHGDLDLFNPLFFLYPPNNYVSTLTRCHMIIPMTYGKHLAANIDRCVMPVAVA
jgi:hypothetical protein